MAATGRGREGCRQQQECDCAMHAASALGEGEQAVAEADTVADVGPGVVERHREGFGIRHRRSSARPPFPTLHPAGRGDASGGGAVRITDMKVNPASGNVYFSVARGTGAGQPALVKLTRDGNVSAVALKGVPFAKVTIPNPSTASPKGGGAPQVITQMAFVDGKVIRGNRHGMLNAVHMAANMASPEAGAVAA